jgi:hypothetical protein
MTKVTIKRDSDEFIRVFTFAYQARNHLLLSGFLPSDNDRHLWEQPMTGFTARITFNHEDREVA